MKNKVLAAAIVAAWSVSGAVGATESADLAEFRQEFLELRQRVERLEQENATLKAQNAQLQTPAEPTRTKADVVGSQEWTDRIAVSGDVRYRHTQTDDARAAAERDDHWLRGRVLVEGRAADHLLAGLGLTTGDNGNPRGGNVRFDGEFSRKPLSVDLAFIDWSFAPGGHAIAGKMRMPFMRPGPSLFWDTDITPEGLAVSYANGPWFGVSYAYWIDENVPYTATPGAGDTTDTKMFGGQFGRRIDFDASKLIVAGMYYDLAAAKGRRPFYNNSSNGNSLTPSGGLAYDFQVAELIAEYHARLVNMPVQLWFDVAKNQAAEYDTAYALGFLLGKAQEARTWEAGLAYHRIEKDALFGQHVDADFGGGMTDSSGWTLRGAYAPVKNAWVSAIYHNSRGNVDMGEEFDFDRLLLDLTVKF